MRFFRLFAVVLPSLVLAVPGPSTSPDMFAEAVAEAISRREASAAPQPMARAASDMELAALLEARQLDLGNLSGLLSNLTASFGAISELLSPDSLANINTVVTQLAYALATPSADQLKGILATASDLLGSDAIKKLIDQLPDLLGSISGLLTPTLITNVTDILGGAHTLLTPDFVSNTKGLINDIAPLVSAIAQVISALLSAVFGTSV